MSDVSALSVKVDATAALSAIVGIQAELVARGLHDVVFAFGKPIAPFDELPPETREWFIERAERLLRILTGDDA